MKTKLIACGAGIFISFCAYAQILPTPQFDDLDNTQDLSVAVDDVLQNLDFSDITTNLLYDKGWKLAEFSQFDGTLNADTLSGHAEWLRQYGSLVTANVSSSGAIPSITTWKAQRNAIADVGKNPLVIMHIDYHRFLTDSVQLSNLIYEQNGKLYDYQNQSASPYEQMTAFSFSPYNTTVYDSLKMTFKTDPSLYKSNTGFTISTIEIDFDNGSGFQTVGLNSDVTVNWTGYGEKILTLKITYTNAQEFIAKSKIRIVQTQNGGAAGAKYNSFADDVEPIAHPTLANHGANLQIAYGCGHDKIVKPYIYVEGFNPEQFGSNKTYSNLFSQMNDYQIDHLNEYQLLDELAENGYDIIYVDFEQNTGSLIENAHTLAEVIKWVNLEKEANNSTEPNIVIGYSMGGVIARLGIRYLEMASIDPDVSYYISVDSPHLGANVPLGVTLAVNDLYHLSYLNENLGDYEENLESAYQVMNSPAALQMLIYSFDMFHPLVGWVNTTRTNFVNELNSVGFPNTTIENIAIAKGNGVGQDQGFATNAEILNIDIQTNYSCFDEMVNIYELFDSSSWIEIGGEPVQLGVVPLEYIVGALIEVTTRLGTIVDAELDINALPGTVPYFLQIYGRKFQARVLWVIPVATSSRYIKIKNAIPFDNSPGGYYSIEGFAGLDGLEDLFDGTYGSCLELLTDKFSFIPTVSALNLENMFTTPFAQIDPIAVVANNDTPFDKAFILDPTYYPSGSAPLNEDHLLLTPSNINPLEYIISSSFDGAGLTPLINDKTYNYGSNSTSGSPTIATSARISGFKTISGTAQSNGGICINCDGRIQVIDDSTFPINNADHYEVELVGNCVSSISSLSIEEFGSLLIGENSSKTGNLVVRSNSWIELNEGVIEVRENSKLIIEAGAELRLNGGLVRVSDGGQIIIKNGGFLRYEDGVIIELNGNDAQLALGGLTHIGDNATFTFTYQGTESGYIRILEEGYWGARFSSGLNADIHLTGEGKNDKILHLEPHADFSEFVGEIPPGQNYTSEGITHLHMEDGYVYLDDNSRLVAIARANFDRMKFQGNGTRGIAPFRRTYIFQSELYNTPVVASLHFLNDHPIQFLASEFFESPVDVQGMGYRFSNCDLFDSQVRSYDCTVANQVIRSNFIGGDGVSDESNTDLISYRSTFTDTYVGLQKMRGSLRVKCSDFESNGYGVEVGPMTTLNMTIDYQAGYNSFNENYTDILASVNHTLLLANGYNQFSNSDPNHIHIFGYTNIPDNPCPPAPLNAGNNYWSPTPTSSSFNIYTQNQMCLVPVDYSVMAPPTECGYYDRPGDPEFPEDPPMEMFAFGGETSFGGDLTMNLFPFITTENHFLNTPFDEAVELATSNTTEIDSVESYIDATSYFYELLNADIGSVNDTIDLMVKNMRWNSLGLYKNAIEMLAADELIVAADNQFSFEPVVQEYVNTLMHFTDSVKTPDNYREQFKLEMYKVTLFKMLNKPEIALQILTNLNECPHDSLQTSVLVNQINQTAQSIQVVQNGISAFLNDTTAFVPDTSVTEISFGSIIDSTGFGTYIIDANNVNFSMCNLSGPSYASMQNSPMDSDMIQFSLYPNPSNGEFTIASTFADFSEEEKQITFTVTDMLGKVVYQQNMANQSEQVNMPKLPASTYLYFFSLDQVPSEHGRLMIWR